MKSFGTSTRGSFSIEASIIFLILLGILVFTVSNVQRSLQLSVREKAPNSAYEEAFLKKVEELRMQKILREERE